ncbi:MAG TPA: NADH-quinone oxidoreductase subunit A [Geobacteraceae bacterium]|nr:NADH-quinone oxidoreductase subunit A [Geobacteraceae bacterium]
MSGAPADTISMNPVFLSEYLPFVVYTFAAILLIGVIHVAAWWLGAKSRSPNKGMPYESGIIPTGSARFAYPVPFYLVAIFFIVFDVESVFIFAWGVAWDVLGLPGLIHITFFIVILLLGLVWLLIKGGLDWGPRKCSKTQVNTSNVEH